MPLSIMMAMVFLGFTGMTFNMMSGTALISSFVSAATVAPLLFVKVKPTAKKAGLASDTDLDSSLIYNTKKQCYN